MMARSSPYWRKEEIQEEIKVTKVNHDQWVVILWCLVQIPIKKLEEIQEEIKVTKVNLKIVSSTIMMARSNPHSSMPSPARSPLGKVMKMGRKMTTNMTMNMTTKMMTMMTMNMTTKIMKMMTTRVRMKWVNSGESRERIRLPVTPNGLGGRPLRPKRQVHWLDCKVIFCFLNTAMSVSPQNQFNKSWNSFFFFFYSCDCSTEHFVKASQWSKSSNFTMSVCR